jgi:hypothetical protein
MSHPRDSEVWKHFDRSYHDFADEIRNVCLLNYAYIVFHYLECRENNTMEVHERSSDVLDSNCPRSEESEA